MHSVNVRRVGRAVRTLARVWQRAFLDALISPGRFWRMMPELRRACDAVFHPGIGDLKTFDFPAEGHVQMLDIDGDGGGMPPQDLYALLRIARWLRPRKIFEFGTFNGLTSAHLAINTEAEVYTLDLPIDLATDLAGYGEEDKKLLRHRGQIGTFYRSRDVERRIHQLFGDSRTFDYTPYRAFADLVIVDGCHLFECVMSDSRHALEILGERGAILWHDFANLMDVTRACKRLAREVPIFHVEGTSLALYLRGIPTPGGGALEKPLSNL